MKRRDFLRTGVAASAALALPQGLVAAAPGDIPASKNSTYERRQRQEPFHLGMAGYTFRHFDIDQALAFMKRLDVHYLCIKDFHLPLDASTEQIAAFKQKLAEARLRSAQYFDDEDLDRFKGRSSDGYTDQEVEEFRYVMYTMQQQEVREWMECLQAREIELPDELKEECYSMMNEV